MTFMGNRDGEYLDYVDVAGDMAGFSDGTDAQLRELFRRIVFSLAVNNTDDHGRNHGFLWSGKGWKLSPAFDVNPNPNVFAMRSTGINGELHRDHGYDALVKTSQAFRLGREQADEIVADVAEAVAGWRTIVPAEIGDAQRRDFEPVFDWLPARLGRAGHGSG